MAVEVARRHLPEEFRFDARYGRLIRKAGIGTIPFALFSYQAELQLQPQEVWFISYILAHRWTSDLPFPSLAQMARNAGLTKRALRNYKDSLVAKGYLTVVDRQRPDGGTTSHGYDFSPLFDILDRCITRDIDRWTRRNPQFLEEDGGLDTEDETVSASPGEQSYPRPGEHLDQGAGKRVLTGRRKASATGQGHSRSPLKEEEHQKEKEERETGVSTGTATPIKLRCKDPEAKELTAVALLATKVSGMLHDAPASRQSTHTRMENLWTASGLSESGFAALMEEALKRTQQASGNIHRPAADGSLGLRNKVPYYLRVLEGLVAERTGVEPLDDRGAGRKERAPAPTRRSSERVLAVREPKAPAQAIAIADGIAANGDGSVTDEALWGEALALLREQMTPANFATWLEGTRTAGRQGDRLVIAATDSFTRDWLEQRLAPTVRRALYQAAERPVDVVFVTL